MKNRKTNSFKLNHPLVWIGAVVAILLIVMLLVGIFDGQEEIPGESSSSDGTVEEGLNRWTAEELAAAKQTYEVDLNHNGVPELLTTQLYYPDGDTKLSRRIWVMEDSDIIWELEERELYGMMETDLNVGYFLYTEDGKDYLLFYRDGYYSAFGGDKYTLELRTLQKDRTGWAETTVKTMEYQGGVGSYTEGGLINPEEAQAFLDVVNGMLGEGQLLLWTGDRTDGYTEVEKAGTYMEDMDSLFAGGKDYTGCATLEEKIERYNQYRMEEWFPDGVMPEPLKNIVAIIEEEFAENALEPREEFAAIAQKREELFEKYLDWLDDKLQILIVPVTESCPVYFSGNVFYRADDGETIEEVATHLLDALLAKKIENGYNQTFEDYELEQQSPRKWSMDPGELADELLDSYCSDGLMKTTYTDAMLEDWIRSEAENWCLVNGVRRLPEDMWLFTPMASYLDPESGEWKPYTWKWEGEAPVSLFNNLLIVKSGDVYRLIGRRDFSSLISQ